jgi:hypothetical protein
LRIAGQAANLIGHYGKTSPCFTRPCGLNGRVERQQIGLFGNALNHTEHFADFIALAMQAVDHQSGLLNGSRQPLDRVEIGLHQFATLMCFFVGGCRVARRRLGVTRHFLHGYTHLMHSGGHHAGLIILNRSCLTNLRTDRAHCLRGRYQLHRCLSQVADQGLLMLKQDVERPRCVRNFITASSVRAQR